MGTHIFLLLLGASLPSYLASDASASKKPPPSADPGSSDAIFGYGSVDDGNGAGCDIRQSAAMRNFQKP